MYKDVKDATVKERHFPDNLILTCKCIVDISSTLWANTSEDTLEIVQTLRSLPRFKKERTTKSEQNLLTIEIATPIAVSIIQRQCRGQKWEKLEGAIALQAPEISDRAKTNSPRDVKR